MFRDLIRRKERRSIPMQTLRARFHAGHLEFLEELKLVEGVEVMITITIPSEVANQPNPVAVTFDTYELGVPFPLTREAIYGNLG